MLTKPILPTSINIRKYKNAVLYFLNHCNNKYLGATKLNKLLYYLDFISYRDRKKIVTGDVYVHKLFGPIPENADEILVKLQEEEKIKVDKVPYKDSGKFKFEANVKSSLSSFDSYEKELLKYLCNTFLPWSSSKIVNQTHLESPWFYSKPYEKVDLKYASNVDFFTKGNKTMGSK